MKQLVKISNSELSYRLNLNYNNVYSRLKMLLGPKASLFADISTKSTGTTWYSDDDVEYTRLSDAPKSEQAAITQSLNDTIASVRKELSSSRELVNYVDDILEIPDRSFVFYCPTTDGYKLILAGWGCKFAHQSTADPNSGFIKRLSRNLEMPDIPPTATSEKKKMVSDIFMGTNPSSDAPQIPKGEKPVNKGAATTYIPHEDPSKQVEEPKTGPVNNVEPKPKIEEPKIEEPKVEEPRIEKKVQHVMLRVLDQNSSPVVGEIVNVRTANGETTKITADNGSIEVGNLLYNDFFSVAFPNIPGNHERSYEVEPNVEIYDAFVKKLIKYSPVLFVEDQDGYAVQDYNIKIIIGGQDSVYNTGSDGVIQLPTMQEGQKFVAVDTANYANVEEYNITHTEAKTPYHFHIKRAEKARVGITVLDKLGTPLPGVVVDLPIGDTPCQQITGEDGRAEFPHELFTAGNIPVRLNVKGKGQIKSGLKYSPDVTEYTIQLRDRRKGLGFDWKWLALIPLILLLGWAGYKLYNMQWGTPTIKEMETGVVLVKTECSYYVETGLTLNNGKPQCFYFEYSANEKNFSNGTFEESERPIMIGTGTGFLISDDGLIATNRHIADPIPPEEASRLVKNMILNEKEGYEHKRDSLEDVLRSIGPLRSVNEQYAIMYKQSQKQQEMVQKYIKVCDKILTLGDFKVKTACRTSVAFVNSIIENWDDFIGCSFRVSGEPGGINEKDVAIIQLKNKNRDIPKGTYIFKVPEKDIMDGEISDGYAVTVLGYNAGLTLADIKNGIHPQPTPGQITIKSDKYNFGYDANTLGGSSGSPVLNKKGELIGVNNANLGNGSGKGFAVRTKYLKELLDDVQNKK